MKQSSEVIVKRKSGITERIIPAAGAKTSKTKRKSNFGVYAASPAPVLKNAEDLKNFILFKSGGGPWHTSQKKRKKKKNRKKKSDMMNIAILVPRIG